jgi:phage tail sheath protein FI
MAFQLSPGVNVSEIDLTTIVPSVATSIGAFAGPFTWGPVGEITTISDEVKLVNTFGKPTADTIVAGGNQYEYWFSASNFLAYTNNLKVVRAANTSSTFNATANGAAVLIKNKSDYEANYSGGANTYGAFASRYAGALGNSIKVSIADANTYATWNVTTVSGNTNTLFTSAPGTSSYASAKGATFDEVHICVIDEDGLFTGTANTVLETFPFASKASDAKDSNGNSNYYKNVIASQSKYVYSMAHPTNTAGNLAWGSAISANSYANLTSALSTSLTGGADGNIVTANVVTAYDSFIPGDSVDVSLIITGPHNQSVITEVISNICEVRKDCVAFISPKKSDVVFNAGSEVTSMTTSRNALTSSSYAVFDGNWKYQYDKYNDVYRYVPMNGDIAGLCARTDNDRDPWYSPGGLNRGIIKNVIKLAFNPTKTDRDNMYVAGINPVVSFQGEGTVLFGDKTMQSKPSAFDRINVRRLFIVLEKAIARAARYSLFEFNDAFTRAQFVSLVEPFLRDVQGRRGIYDFRVVCDTTNNTPEVIDGNRFVGDIYIKPARSINFIQLNFVAVRTGVSFDEVVGKF